MRAKSRAAQEKPRQNRLYHRPNFTQRINAQVDYDRSGAVTSRLRRWTVQAKHHGATLPDASPPFGMAGGKYQTGDRHGSR